MNLTLCFRNANMAAYLGDTKMKMLQEFGSIKEKYGAQPASCHNVFQSVCPWDSAGMSAIFMKLMVSPQPHPLSSLLLAYNVANVAHAAAAQHTDRGFKVSSNFVKIRSTVFV